MPRVGKPPPSWFEKMLGLQSHMKLTRPEIADFCEVSVNAVNKAFQRYSIKGVPGVKANGAPVIIYHAGELKRLVTKVVAEYDGKSP